MTRWVGLAAGLFAAALLWSGPLRAADRTMSAVASFTILADMVRQVGGEHVQVAALVGPDGDAHAYDPSPADARAVSKADLIFVNGLGFDDWMSKLAKAAGYKGPVIVASTGARIRRGDETHDPDHGRHGAHSHGRDRNLDPHAWQDLGNGQRYVTNIAEALAKADPEHAADYKARADTYNRELSALDAEARAMLDSIPRQARKIITSHDAFGYLGQTYGITFLAPVGLSTDSQPSAKQVAALIRQMKRERVRALFMENITDRRLVEQISREGGGIVGGRVYSDALSGPDGPAPSYTAMFRHNLQEFISALRKQTSS